MREVKAILIMLGIVVGTMLVTKMFEGPKSPPPQIEVGYGNQVVCRVLDEVRTICTY